MTRTTREPAFDMSETHETFDLVIICAAPVGENIADRAAQGGLSAVIVERELVGGEGATRS